MKKLLLGRSYLAESCQVKSKREIKRFLKFDQVAVFSRSRINEGEIQYLQARIQQTSVNVKCVFELPGLSQLRFANCLKYTKYPFNKIVIRLYQ